MYTFLIVMLILLSLLLHLGFRALFENKHNRRNAFANKFTLDGVIRRNRLSLSEIDTLGNKVIALDRKNNKIILVEHRNMSPGKNVFPWDNWNLVKSTRKWIQ